MAVRAAAPCHCAHASFEHALIRCGCTNDRAHRHHDDPMKNADDAFHRVWCCTCATYCSKDSHCPLPLPELSGATAMQKKLPRPFLVRLPLQILSLPMYLWSSIRSWFGNLASRARRAPVSSNQEKVKSQ